MCVCVDWVSDAHVVGGEDGGRQGRYQSKSGQDVRLLLRQHFAPVADGIKGPEGGINSVNPRLHSCGAARLATTAHAGL